ncbi:conserved hypothetical protein [Neospora caninum Liverpool]|uniref:Uncharacterized protein n=1 Tax=Neospora caninum (strain Liverpool) TaxID=572307 RepID=F0VM28_NEOCL|nr:conserved hypothetical protein [Neospora caninum Liverpool]CBZ54306.1 conserved hypothetical protein [Neospora caninum Liverpool]CEL69012.1 TPA: hypothetical protein BN1204_047380 [Neospora caninum Liverpool]|eukprot:XP_003884337.1 conserved hypothetical protein [Neospora caninum Liverpool]
MASFPLVLFCAFLLTLLSEAGAVRMSHQVTLAAEASRHVSPSFLAPGGPESAVQSGRSQGRVGFVEVGKGREAKKKSSRKETEEEEDERGSLEEYQSQEEGSHPGDQSEVQEEEEEEALAKEGRSSSKKRESDKVSRRSSKKQNASAYKSASGAHASGSDALDDGQDEGSGVAEEEQSSKRQSASGSTKKGKSKEVDEEGSAAADDEGEEGSAQESQGWKEDGSAKEEAFDEGSPGSSKRRGGGASEREHEQDSVAVSSRENEGSSRTKREKGKTRSRRRNHEEEDGSSSEMDGPLPAKQAKTASQANGDELKETPKQSQGERTPPDPDAPRLGYKNCSDVCSSIGCKEVLNSDVNDTLEGCCTTVECTQCSGTGVEADHKSCRNWRMSRANEIVLANGIFKIPRGTAKAGDEIHVRVAWDRPYIMGVNACAPDLRQAAAIAKNTLEFPGQEERSALHSLSAALQPVCLANSAQIGPLKLRPDGLSRVFASSWFSFPAFSTPTLLTNEFSIKLHCGRDDCAADMITGCVRILCPATLPQVEAKLRAITPVSAATASAFHPGLMAGQMMGFGVSAPGFPQPALVPRHAGMMPMQHAGMIPLMPAVRPLGMGIGRFWMMPR